MLKSATSYIEIKIQKKKCSLQQGKRTNLDWEDKEEAARAVTGVEDLDICTGSHLQERAPIYQLLYYEFHEPSILSSIIIGIIVNYY